MARNQANSSQIKDGAILSQHIAVGAIQESHLNLDWTAKATEILESKKVVDYVQGAAATATANSSTIDLSALVSLPEAATANDLGVVVTGPNNKVILTEEGNSSKLLVDAATSEVIYARIETGLTATFYTVQAGVETEYTFADETHFGFQYPARFTLSDVSEMFAANEKFVDGATDVTTRLDVAQVAKDLFGAAYTLNKDGVATLSKTIVDQIADLVAADLAIDARIGAVEGDVTTLQTEVDTIENDIVTLQTNLDEAEAKAIDAGEKAVEADSKAVAAQTAADQAIADVASAQAMADLADEKAAEAQSLANTVNTNLSTLSGDVDTLTDKVNGLETSTSTFEMNAENRFTSIEDDINNVRDLIVDASYVITKVDKQFNEVEVASGVTTFVLPNDKQPKEGQADVYYNGMLQMLNVHYTETVVDDSVTAIQFAPELIVAGDVVQLRWL